MNVMLPLADPSFYAGDFHPDLARLRAEGPVSWHDDLKLWAVAGHAEVVAVSRDPATFRSGAGVLLGDRDRTMTPGESIVYLDPPDHGVHRRLVNPAFHARRIAGLETFVRDLTRRLLDALEPGAPVDAVEALAVPLPLLVIAELLGIPAEDREQFRTWTDATIEAADSQSADTLVMLASLYDYFGAIAAERREHPGDDLVSVLVTSEVDGVALTTAEIMGFCMTLLVAGNETTRNLISGGILALAERPDQRARLSADPAAVPTGVEELLRWVTPVNGFCRTATRDVDLGGQSVREGDYLFLLYPSANRDVAAFGPTADRLDVGRDPNPHVAFGFAEHFCLGAGLARLEARVLFEELLGRFPHWDLVGEPRRLASTVMHGLTHLPVAFAAR